MDKFRKEIDTIDSQILELLAKRISCAKEIGKIKNDKGEEVYVPSREKIVFENLLKKNAGKVSEQSIRAIYREIISASISAEKKLTVSYLGPKATFTHQAAIKNFGSSVEYISAPSIPDVFLSVQAGDADYGVIPIENSTEGAVMHSIDILAETSLVIVGQIYLPIEHCLLSRGKLENIRRVCSKDQAIAQCRDWLRRNLSDVELEPVDSTTTAVRMAKENPEIAAIASEVASTYYNVPILEHGIQDLKDNQTRFLVIGKTPNKKAENVKYGTSMVVSINDRPGALSEVIKPFEKAGINLMRIESRPSRKKAWDYYFFIDFEGHWEDSPACDIVKHLRETLPMIKWLGSFPM
ncbi:MAG: prephenate dehydratase [Opitutales bacterium]|nr:prephenate dehydratase [Opitutales bacterium]